MVNNVLIQQLGVQPYEPVVDLMQRFTDRRGPDTPDEIWVLQHTPVFTLGQAADHAHVLDAGPIRVVQSDRGGQVTYHGPGQIVVYLMVDLRRRGMGVRSMVELIENTVIKLLDKHHVSAQSRRSAPGVFVGDSKIAALGLRVRRGCTFHGLSFNVDMDLAPFARINPCGYAGMAVTQLCSEVSGPGMADTSAALAALLLEALHNQTTLTN